MMKTMKILVPLLWAGVTTASTQEWLAGYEPYSQITDYAAIDLDQKILNERAGQADFFHAGVIYEQGGHSGSYATIQLLDPEPELYFPAGTQVLGISERNITVRGVLLKEATWGTDVSDVKVKIEYFTSDVQSMHVDCMVGGLFTMKEGSRGGCLTNTGTVEFLPVDDATGVHTFAYSYDGRKDNMNYRTLQKFSTEAHKSMHFCGAKGTTMECGYHEDFQLFLDYYGGEDFGDQWVKAALEGTHTTFPSKRGNAPFDDYSNNGGGGRMEAARRGAVVLNVFPELIHKLEQAVHFCSIKCTKDNMNVCSAYAVKYWDQAWAFYSGSLEGEDGKGTGVLQYALADRNAREMKTAGYLSNESKGKSYINHEVLHRFNQGQAKLLSMDDDRCDYVNTEKKRIVRLLKVPFLQSMYQAAWLRENNPREGELYEARGASYAAALLPYIHACSETAADTVYKMMTIGSDEKGALDFATLKKTLEDQYQCLGVKCAEVGGVSKDGSFMKGAEPCFDGETITDRTPQEEKTTNNVTVINEGSGNMGIILGILLVLLGAVAIFGMVLLHMGRRRKNRDNGHQKNIAAVTTAASGDLA